MTARLQLGSSALLGWAELVVYNRGGDRPLLAEHTLQAKLEAKK